MFAILLVFVPFSPFYSLTHTHPYKTRANVCTSRWYSTAFRVTLMIFGWRCKKLCFIRSSLKVSDQAEEWKWTGQRLDARITLCPTLFPLKSIRIILQFIHEQRNDFFSAPFLGCLMHYSSLECYIFSLFLSGFSSFWTAAQNKM